MTEGTKSMLFGCHQIIIHPLIVLVAWYRLYRRWPKPWQLVCILIHDIGHWGKDYLTYFEHKRDHWRAGAELARRLFGDEAYWFCRWHSKTSNGNSWQPNDLFYADKYSWLCAPRWWLKLNDRVERFGDDRSLDDWLAMVRENWDAGCPKGSHQLYLDLKERKDEHMPNLRQTCQDGQC